MEDWIEPPADDLSRITARLFDHPWEDINAYEQEPVQAAIDAGYSEDEINAFRGRASLQDRLSNDLTYRTLSDPQFASGLRAPKEPIPLTPMDELPSYRIGQIAGRDDTPVPNPMAEYIEPPASDEDYGAHARESYANALLRGEISSPRDFAERYAGALWGADPDADPGSLVRHSQLLANTLPSDEDFTDQAIAIAQSQQIDLTPEAIRTIKERVVDKWAESDKSLLEIYRDAQLDPEFAQSLTAAPPEQPNWLDQFGTGVRDIIGSATRLAVNALPESFVRTVDEVNNTLSDAGFPLAKVPVGQIDALERGRLAALSEEGGDASWWRWGGEVAATLPMFTTLGLSGAWGLIAAGATGGAAAGAFDPSTAQDYWSDVAEKTATGAVFGAGLGAALHGIGKAVASMSPRAAALLRDTIAGMEEPKVKVLDPGAELPSTEVRASEALKPINPAEPIIPEAVEGVQPKTSFTKFAEDATPMQKMGALARDIDELSLQNRGVTPDEFSHPNFFANLAEGQDTATVALAQGMDAAKSIGGYLADLGRDLLRDESGALTMFRTPAQKLEKATRNDARDYVQPLLIKGMGAVARAMEEYGAKFDYYRTTAGQTINLHKLINPHMPEWREELAKGAAGNPMGTVIGDMIKYIEGRSAGYTMKSDNPLGPVADTIRAINQDLRLKMEDAQQRGLHNMTSYYEDYFRHIWKDPNAADQAFGVARQGSGASFQQRSLPTIEDGLTKGLVPKYEHPIELVMTDAAEKTRYLQVLGLLDEARNTTSPLTGEPFAYWGTSRKNPTDVMLNGVGTTKKIPALSATGKPLPDLQMWANPAFAKNWNDNISTGFFARDFSGKVFENLNYLKNLQTQGQLIGPFFHARTMAMETIAGGFANVVAELTGAAKFAVQGDFGKMLTELGHAGIDLAKSTAVPYKISEQIMFGGKGLKIYQGRASDPVLDPIISLLTEANARFGKRQEIYRFGTAPTLWESLSRGSLGEEYRAQISKWLGDASEPLDYRIARAATTRLFGFAAHELGRVLNSTTGPLFDFAIPRMKIATNIERMQTAIRQNPTATREQLVKTARQIVNNTDDRMGEMNMDNIFWPKAVKQAAQLSMISPGWVYGSMRFFSNAIGMNMERGNFVPFTEYNHAATTSLVGFAMAYSMFNSVTHMLYNGEMPSDWKDVVIGPLTGGIIKGVQERVMAPSQAKEIFDYGKIIATGIFDPWKVPQAIKEFVLGKMPGLGQIWRGLMSGEDAIGHKIGSLPGGWPAFILKNLTPIMATSSERRKIGTEINPWDMFFGAKEVPKFANDPEGFYKGLQYVADKEQKEEHYRALAENKIYEQQREVPDLPASMQRSGGRSGGHTLNSDELASRKITTQRRYRSDEMSMANLPPVFGTHNARGSRRTLSSDQLAGQRVTTDEGVTRLAGRAPTAPRARVPAAPRVRAAPRRRTHR